MIKKAAAVAALLLLVGCHTGRVTMNQVNTVDVPVGGASGALAAPEIPLAQVIYFQETGSTGDSPLLFSGIGFLSTRATTTRPYLMHLNPSLWSGAIRDELAASVSGIAFIAPEISGGASHIDYVVPESMEHIGPSIRQAQALSVSPDAAWMGWTKAGAGYLYSVSNQSTYQIPAKDLDLALIRIPTKNRVWVSGSKSGQGTTIEYSLEGAQIRQLSEIETSRVSVSPNGDEAAWFDSNSKKVVVHRESHSKDASFSLSAEPVDLTWASEDDLLYWSRISDSTGRIRSFNIQTGAEEDLVDIEIDSQTGPGMVCPVLADSKIFFADERDGSFAVQKAESPGWGVSQFAYPTDGGTQFLCPLTSNGGNSQ